MPSLWPLTCLFILPAIGSALRWAVPWLRDAFSAMFSNRQWESILWQNDPGSAHLKQIGKGQCGTIWTLVGSRDVIKVPNPGKADQLWNDCCTHRMIEETLRTTPVDLRRDINIPQFCTWTQLIFNTPTNEARHKRPTYALVSSRIDPVTESLRREVVRTLAPPYANKRSILAAPENKDCLIRLYLGRRGQRSITQAFRLRIFDLMVNEMEELQFQTSKFAAVMAKTLAILHWSVGVDADDVEFVLGRSPIHKMPPSASELTGSNKDDARFLCQGINAGERGDSMWLLDFNQCRPFSDDDDGIKQLERSFYFNDPYYPRPHANHPDDVALWATFRDNYLEASSLLTDSVMPARFIEAVIAEGLRRKAGGSIFQ